VAERIRIGTAVLEFTVDDAGVVSGLRKINQDVASSAEAMAAQWKQVGQQATTLGSALTKSLTVPIVGIASASVLAFSQFDDAMTKSTAIMGTLTQSMRDDLERAARDVGKTTTFSAKEAADAYYFLASAGLDAASAVKALPVVAQFAQAGAFDLARATDLLTDAQSALGLTIRDDAVANMENMVQVSDVLVKANTLANASVSQFSESLTNKGAAALRLVNKNMEEGVAVLAAFADQGIKGTEAGEKLNIVLRDLQTQSIKHGDAFAKMGISVYDSAGNMRNMADIVGDLEKALMGMSDEQKRSTLMMLGFQDRSVSAIATLLGFSENIRGYESALKQAGGTTQEVADKQLQSFQAQMTLLWHKLTDVGIELGKALVPALQTAMGALAAVEPVLRGIVTGFTNLPGPIQLTAIAILALVAAAGPAIYLFGQLALASAALATSFGATGFASRLLFADLGFVATGLRAAGLSALTTTTQFGVMGAASIGLTGAVTALWAAMAAHPLVALAAALGAVTGALTKLYERYQNNKQAELISSIKAETIARAEQAGAVLKETDAKKRYLEAVDALQKLEDIRRATFDQSAAAQQRALDAEIALGRITQEQANSRQAALAGEQQAAEVRKNKISITDAARIAEESYRKEIESTGYSESELLKSIAQNIATFDTWAKQIGLSSATIARLKNAIKETAKELKDTTKESDAAAKSMADLEKAGESLGIMTTSKLNRSIGELQLALTSVIRSGAPLPPAIDAMVMKLRDVERDARRAGLDVTALTATIKELNQWSRVLAGAPPILDPKLYIVARNELGSTLPVAKAFSAEYLVGATNAALLKTANERLGVESRAALIKTATQARASYNDILASGLYTADQLTAARQRVIEAERAAGLETESIWRVRIRSAVDDFIAGSSQSISAGLVDMIGHWNRHTELLKGIWQGIKNTFLNVLDEMLSSFINGFLKGMLKAIGAARLGQTLASSLLGGVGLGGTAASVAGTAATTAASGGGAAAAAGGLGALGTAAAIAGGIALPFIIGALLPDYTSAVAPSDVIAAYRDYFGEDYESRLPEDLTGVMPWELPGYRWGTPNLDYESFRSSGTPAILHNDEAVVPRGSGHQLAGEIAAALKSGGGNSGAPPIVNVYVGNEQFRSYIVETNVRAIEDNRSGGAPVSLQTRYRSALGVA
jgi:TP901 family phage tail tape measure protein